MLRLDITLVVGLTGMQREYPLSDNLGNYRLKIALPRKPKQAPGCTLANRGKGANPPENCEFFLLFNSKSSFESSYCHANEYLDFLGSPTSQRRLEKLFEVVKNVFRGRGVRPPPKKNSNQSSH